MRETIKKDIVRYHSENAHSCPTKHVLRESDELYEVVIEVELLFIEAALVVLQYAENERVLVEHPVVGIRRVADHDGEALVAFDFVHGGGFVGEGVEADERELFHPRFEGVGEIDSGAFLGAKAVAGLCELEADFHVGDGVGGHHQLEGVEAREEVLRHVVVPRGALLGVGEALLLPLGCEGAVDDVDDFDEEGGRAGGGVEDLDKGFVRGDGALFARLVGEGREFQAGVLFQHLAPGGGVGETVGEAELGLQEFVDAADDVGDDGLRGVEDAAILADLFIVGLEETFEEVHHRVFLAIAVAEVLHHCLKVGAIQQLDHIADAELIEVESGLPRLAFTPTEAEERFHQFPQERAGVEIGDEVIGRLLAGIDHACGEQAVGDGLCVGIGELIFIKIMDERFLERFHQAGQRSVRGLDGQPVLNLLPDVACQFGEFKRKLLCRLDYLAVPQRECRAPSPAPLFGIPVIRGPGKFLLERARHLNQMERRVLFVPAEDFQYGEILRILGRSEVGQSNLAFLPFAVVGDEQKIIRSPCRVFGAVAGGFVLKSDLPENAAERHDRQAFGLEFYKENPPRLRAGQWAEALDLIDLGSVLGVNAKFLWREIEEIVVDFLKIITTDGPIKFIT